MTEIKRCKLSSRGLQNVAKCNHPADFKFIVGKKEYKIPSFFADFISPRIAKCHSIDPCMNYFVVDIEDPHEYFPIFLDFVQGKFFSLSQTQRTFFTELSHLLENNDLLTYVLDINSRHITYTNCLSSLEEKARYSLDISVEIDTIAHNFHKFNPSLLKELDVSLLMRILHSPHLVVESEQHLFDFVYSLASSNPTYIILFSCIKFECLNEESMTKFNSLVSYENMDPLIWSALERRLTLETKKLDLSNRYNRKIIQCPYTGEMFHGIMDYLRSLHDGRNPVEAGEVDVTVKVQECNVKVSELFNRGALPRLYLS